MEYQLGDKKISGMSINRNIGQRSHNTDLSSIQKNYSNKKQGSSFDVGERVLKSSMRLKSSLKRPSIKVENHESQLNVPKLSTMSLARSPINTPGGHSNSNFVAESLITLSDFNNKHRDHVVSLIDAHDQKRWKHLSNHLPQKLASPFILKNSNKKRVSKRDRSDPIRKVIQANKSVQRKKLVTNQKLLAILERIEFDRPILIRDKLEIIWEGKSKKETNTIEVSSIQKGIDLDEETDYAILEDLDV